eukprot:TRINITY_DN4380_c0_g1_i1.p1 TRINITY_DN4380_c0_g1~~TRINITY_DN4380_c0_g1_i1.p1  ORF type:complete len:363 (-),score=66.44 TRINITY_DN4380_c0_g1_i1:51-1139(-)
MSWRPQLMMNPQKKEPVVYGPERVPFDPSWESDCPLFMENLPENCEDNPALAALQNMQYEDNSPTDMGQHFKGMGNEAFQKGPEGYRDALYLYKRALDENDPVKENVSVYYSNRAAVHLKLGNYGRALDDCKDAIKNDPKNIKAYFRAGTACMATKKLNDCNNFCRRGLKVNPKNRPLLQLQKKVKEAIRLRVQKRVEDSKYQKVEDQTQLALDQALEQRGLKFSKTLNIGLKNHYNPKITFVDAECTTLAFGVAFLYPEYQQTDFIEAFCETTPIADMVGEIFSTPAMWDERRDYTADAVDVYYETEHKTTRKLNQEDSLLEVLLYNDHDVAGFPVFSVLKRGSEFQTTWEVDTEYVASKR